MRPKKTAASCDEISLGRSDDDESCRITLDSTCRSSLEKLQESVDTKTHQAPPIRHQVWQHVLSIVKAAFVISIWYIGSAYHSIITKRSLSNIGTDLYLADRLVQGSVVTSVQLSEATIFALPLLLLYIRSNKFTYYNNIKNVFTRQFFIGALLYAIANIFANTALGGGRVLVVQVIKCSEILITTVISWLCGISKSPGRQVAPLIISSAGIFIVVFENIITSTDVTYIIPLVFALLGSISIASRNIIVSKSNESPIISFCFLSFFGSLYSICITSLLLLCGGHVGNNIDSKLVLLSGIFHSSYNLASLTFLSIAVCAVSHAYFNALKRAVVVISAEIFFCTLPSSLQIAGALLALLGLHCASMQKEGKKNDEKKVIEGSIPPQRGARDLWWGLLVAIIFNFTLWQQLYFFYCR
eukprot:GHVR01020548.1.p1 GENE.GHVR01020548.1~~GHVR01020548.1.p1  ORF type:complete len:414 (+),score=72.78 GHVR01020548.1:39-1280(+)